jgi:uncharacterized protein YutE (UPF0331/DUF86 family)
MPDRDIMISKTGSIQRCLNRIKDVTSLEPASLEDQDKQDIFILNLQRAIQACIDLAAHVVASEGLGVPDTVKENFSLLNKKGIITADLASRMGKMTGFQNIAIYDYLDLDLEILKSILAKDLRDLEEFYVEVLGYYGFGKG